MTKETEKNIVSDNMLDMVVGGASPDTKYPGNESVFEKAEKRYGSN